MRHQLSIMTTYWRIIVEYHECIYTYICVCIYIYTFTRGTNDNLIPSGTSVGEHMWSICKTKNHHSKIICPRNWVPSKPTIKPVHLSTMALGTKRPLEHTKAN